jgi:5-methylthioribose kinase
MMREITTQTAADYLRSTGQVPGSEPIEVRELAGGVSNIVLLVTLPSRDERFVLKQARSRLRVSEEWLCPVERIWREVEVLRICSELLQTPNDEQATLPRLLWEDRENYVYAMTAAPPEHRTWKELLLTGETAVSESIAVCCGRLLGQLHAASWGNTDIARRLDDRTYFKQLRLDPYYRHIARHHADTAGPIEQLIDSVWRHRHCLVHGDFSPKNVLAWPGQLMLIDFEVGHFGDPAFDLGFFLTHLVLKSIWAGRRQAEYLALASSFWLVYRQVIARVVPPDQLASLEQRMLWNLAGCLLARVDGKSPVDYLSTEQQSVVRELARRWLAKPPQTWDEAAAVIAHG